MPLHKSESFSAKLIVFAVNRMAIQKRLVLILIAIVIVIMMGSSGYYLIFGGKPGFLNCMYMTIISLTSVGYGEVIPVTGNIPAQVFTMVLITFGMGIILYGISTLTAIIIEGELSGILRRTKMEKQIGKLSNHYIVCGGGETGRHVIAELAKNRENVVLIELDEEKIDRCKLIADLLFVKGDATDDENLITAGIDKAKGIVISLPSDKDTLYVTMAARMRNRNMRIISRMVDHKHEPKLRKAGADGVVSPNFIGGLRMASEMLRPTVVDFLDSMLRSKQGNLRIHELRVSENSQYKGKTIQDSGFKAKYDILILGAKQPGREIRFNPTASTVLEEGMTLIVMGDVADIANAKKAF